MITVLEDHRASAGDSELGGIVLGTIGGYVFQAHVTDRPSALVWQGGRVTLLEVYDDGDGERPCCEWGLCFQARDHHKIDTATVMAIVSWCEKLPRCCV